MSKVLTGYELRYNVLASVQDLDRFMVPILDGKKEQSLLLDLFKAFD